jgi:hypothetical protein
MRWSRTVYKKQKFSCQGIRSSRWSCSWVATPAQRPNNVSNFILLPPLSGPKDKVLSTARNRGSLPRQCRYAIPHPDGGRGALLHPDSSRDALPHSDNSRGGHCSPDSSAPIPSPPTVLSPYLWILSRFPPFLLNGGGGSKPPPLSHQWWRQREPSPRKDPDPVRLMARACGRA